MNRIVLPEEDRAPLPIRFTGHELVLKATSQDTDGAFTTGVLKAEPMSGPPLHLHTREDEWFYVLKGEFTFEVGGERFTAGPHSSVFTPRNVPHTWQNCTTEVAEALVLAAPGQIDAFYEEAIRGPLDDSLMSKYGIVRLGPPLTR